MISWTKRLVFYCEFTKGSTAIRGTINQYLHFGHYHTLFKLKSACLFSRGKNEWLTR